MIVGDKIIFIHCLNDLHLPVEAKLIYDEVFSIPAKSLKKGLLKVADETLLTKRNNDLETVMKLFLSQNLQKPESSAEKPIWLKSLAQ